VKKRDYNQWFSSPLIHEILSTYNGVGMRSARSTVSILQHRRPLQYSDLKEQTVRSWFDPDKKLYPKYMRLLESGQYVPGPGRERVFAAHPDVEQKIMEVLLQMRESNKTGVQVGRDTIRWVMKSIITERAPHLLDKLTLSNSFISLWAHKHMQWTYRVATTTASKVPDDWHQQGVQMGKRVAVAMATYDIHPSLVINADQVGLHLVPASTRTYETKGSRTVPLVGVDDKRQITVVVGSSLDGTLLPLQLIFTGKTDACLPKHTEETRKVGFHLTKTENHWSSLQTMQEFVEQVVVPHRKEKMRQHSLVDAHVVLLLDVWGVHIGAPFRNFIAEQHPYIHLVYIPPNCTSKLQVADVALNYPFKHGVKKRFNAWAAQIVDEQIRAGGEVIGIKPYCGMAAIKPQLLQWALESWKSLAAERLLILKGWQICLISLYDVNNSEERTKAMAAAIRQEIPAGDAVPDGREEEEPELDEDGFIAEESEDEEKTETQIMKERVFGERKSSRHSAPPQRMGYMLNSSQLKLS
jgi:hypothetical protein